MYITSTLGPTTGDAGGEACPVTAPGSPFLSIGSVDEPVPNAGLAGQDTIAVSCTVHSTGASGYSIDLSVYDGNVAEITISGMISNTLGTAQSGVSATFSQPSGTNPASYSASDCTLTLSTEHEATIASGRIWATVTCPTIENVVTDATCSASATFIFENCSE